MDALGTGILTILHTLVVSVFGFFLWLSGLAFDLAISQFVLGFGAMYGTGGFGVVIDDVWGTVRDIFNLTFIFGLVWIGFQIILGINESNAKRTIVTLIGAALLVNFSLFITKFVVDFSNVAAFQIASAFAAPNAISTSFVELVGFSSIFNANGTLPTWSEFGSGAGIMYVIGSMVFMLVLTFVFFAAAIMLTIRFVVLNIYMVLSPFMFLGWVFPSLSGTSKKYWSGFLGRAFFAPAFIFMLYLSYRVLSSIQTPGNGQFGNIFQTAAPINAGEIIIYFILTTVFIIASLIVAQKMGAQGATTAVNLGNSMVKYARGGVQGFAYRNTAGLALSKGVKGVDALDRAAERGGVRGFAAKVTRTAIGGESARKALEKGANYGAGGYGRADVEKMDKERKNRATSGNANLSVGDAINASIKDPSNSPDGIKARIKLEQAISGASTAQLIEQLKKYKPESPEYKAVVQNMTQNQFDDVLKAKEEDFDNASKDSLRKARGAAVQTKLTRDITTGAPISLTDAIQKNASVEELQGLGFDTLLSNAGVIPASKMDDLKKKYTETQFQLLSTRRKEVLIEAAGKGTSEIKALTKNLKPKDFAKLPKELFTDSRYLPNTYSLIGVGPLEQIAYDRDILDPAERKNLKAYLLNPMRNTGVSGVTKDVKDYLKSTEGEKFYGK